MRRYSPRRPLVELFGPILPSIQIAMLLNPFLMTILTTSCGVTIPCLGIGKWARMRLYYLDYFTRVMGAQ